MSGRTNIIYSCCFVLRIILLIVFWFFQFIHPQPFPSKYIFENLSIEHGLSSSAVYSIHQDKTGFLWLGTENGLNRYDGYSFKIYKHNTEDESSISDNFIWNICEDSEGSLWFATNNGLNKYDPVTEKFVRYYHKPGNKESINGNEISSLTLDAENNLWIGTWGSGINKYDFRTKKFIKLNYDKIDLSNEVVWCLFKDKRNNIWIGTENGNLLRYNWNEKEFIHFGKSGNKSFSLNAVTSICEDQSGNIWISTYGSGLSRYDYKSNSFMHFRNDKKNSNSICDDFIWKVYEDSKGLLWIGSVSKGISIYDHKKNSFTHLASNPFDFQGLSSDYILGIFEDAANNLWIGTVGAGVNKLNLNPQNFYQLKNELNNSNSLNNNFIFTICEDRNGDVWIGTYEGGINRYNPPKNKFTVYKNNSADSKSLSGNQVRKIFEDIDGNIWAATYFGGLNKYEKKSDSFIRYIAGSKGLINDNIREIFEDSDKNLWLGSHGGGLIMFNKDIEEFHHFRNDPENEQSISDNVVNSICEDSEKNLWIGTYTEGLNKFDKRSNSFKRYTYIPNDSTSLSADYITIIYCDSKGNIWVGTWSGGLNLYDKKNDSFIRFSEKDGLLADIICGIGEDKKGNLWITSVKGISKFDKEKREFKNYDISDGIQKGELNPGAFFINKNGWIYFGGTEGVNVFHPDSLKARGKIPSVAITSVKKFNEVFITEKQLPFIEKLEFKHDENVISFEFASLDFTRPQKNQYAYKLEGFDKNWIYSGSRRFVTYTNLDPGIYIFKVKATNSDGIWNDKGSLLGVTINPPWWRTGWAYAGYILLIISGLYVIRRFEKNRIKLRHELKMHEFESNKLREIESMKSRFFANLSHEFRTPLMLIKGPAEQLITEHPEGKIGEQLQMINRNSQNLQRLIDQLLELSQLESASIPLKAKEENVVTILKGLTYSFDSLASQKNISLAFYSENEILNAWIDKDKFEKIMNNLLSNSFKFTGEGGKISVIIEKNDLGNNKFINIRISDTGVGIPEDKLEKIFDRFYQADDSSHKKFGGSGIGLALVKELVELHKWSISVTSKENVGTEFLLNIPLGDYLTEKEISREGFNEDNYLTKHEADNSINGYKNDIEKPGTSGNDAIRPSILIVDDSADVRKYISGLLYKNYNLLEAKEGNDGIESARKNSPDLIISDIMMPVMDGIEFCRRIKSNLETSHIPVILLTAKVTSESKIEGLETGADDYLTKPFDSKELFIRVKNLLEQRKRLKEKFGKDLNVNPSFITQNLVDKEFLEKAFSIAEKNLDNPDFDAESFAKNLFMSLSQLRRKLKAVTGQAPGEFLRVYKLKRAAQMILEKRLSITQISLEVGFNSPSHFTKAFREQFNCLPSDFNG